MKKIHEVSKLSRISIRTLHYYDKIGLLTPAQVTENGYRLYDDADLERLQSILIFRELRFPLKEIRKILDSPLYDRNLILEQQINLLRLQKENLEKLIDFACEIKTIGVKKLDFSVFDTSKIDEYAAQAKETWGKTEAYKEFEEKSKGRTVEEDKKFGNEMLRLFEELGKMKDQDPASGIVQIGVKKIQDFITGNYYTCTKEIFKGLGAMYAAGGSMTENIDKAGGVGTAEFVAKAIEVYCKE